MAKPHFLVQLISPDRGEIATLSYKRDHPLRSWKSGVAFDPVSSIVQKRPPAEPIRVDIKPGGTLLADLWLVPIPLVSDRLADAFARAGVVGLDRYRAELHASNGTVHGQFSAFNLLSTAETIEDAETRGLELFWMQGSLVASEAAKGAFDSLGSDIGYCHATS